MTTKIIVLKRVLIIALFVLAAFGTSSAVTWIIAGGAMVLERSLPPALAAGTLLALFLLLAGSIVAIPTCLIAWSYNAARRKMKRRNFADRQREVSAAGGEALANPVSLTRTDLPPTRTSPRWLLRRGLILGGLAAGVAACAAALSQSLPTSSTPLNGLTPCGWATLWTEVVLLAAIPALLTTWTARGVWRLFVK